MTMMKTIITVTPTQYNQMLHHLRRIDWAKYDKRKGVGEKPQSITVNSGPVWGLREQLGATSRAW